MRQRNLVSSRPVRLCATGKLYQQREFTRMASRLRMKRQQRELDEETEFGARRSARAQAFLYSKHKETCEWLYKSVFYNACHWLRPAFERVRGKGQPRPRHLIDFGCGDGSHLFALLRNNRDAINYRRVVGVDINEGILQKAELTRRALPIVFHSLELITEDCRFIQMPELYDNLQNDFNDALLFDVLNCVDDLHNVSNVLQSLQLCLKTDSNIVGMVVDPTLDDAHSHEFYLKYGIQVLDANAANLIDPTSINASTPPRRVQQWTDDSTPSQLTANGSETDSPSLKEEREDAIDTFENDAKSQKSEKVECANSQSSDKLSTKVQRLELPSVDESKSQGSYEFVRNGNMFRILADCSGTRQCDPMATVTANGSGDVHFGQHSNECMYLERVFWDMTTLEDMFEKAHLVDIEFHPLHTLAPDPTLDPSQQRLFNEFANESNPVFMCFTAKKQRVLPLYADRTYFDYSSPTKLLDR